MKGVLVPDREEDFTADPVELFFDLAFVFAFSRLVYHLVHHPDWTGVGEFALLFTLIWMPWSNFTWAANAVSGNQRSVRALFLVGTVASVPMAASVSAAFGDGGASFAIPLAVILSMGPLTMIFGLPSDDVVRSSTIQYAIPVFVTSAMLLVGGFLDREARIVVWIAAALVMIAGTIAAGRSEWIVRPGHFAERHGLIIIIALGEVIVAMSVPVVEALEAGDGLPAQTLVALVAAGTFACLLWWAYFDRVLPALEHGHHQQPDDKSLGRFARDVYTYSHLPIVAGIILAAAAVEEVALHPKDELPPAFRWMLFGGMALFYSGVAISVWRAFRVVARERLVAGVLLAGVVAVSGSVSGLTLLLAVDAFLVVALVAEHLRIERMQPAAETDEASVHS
jgi:low temperature requirement protein LtrA